MSEVGACGVNRPTLSVPGDLGVLDLKSQPQLAPGVWLARIKSSPEYAALPVYERALADEGMRLAKASPHPGFYLQRLYELVTTPEDPASQERLRHEANAQLRADLALAKSQRAGCDVALEETSSKDTGRVWRSVVGHNGKTYEVDSRDPNDIHIRVRVCLTGPQAADVRQLEDLIEKTLGRAGGFTVDLQFVDKPGPNVFSAGSDSTKWPSVSNWSAGAFASAHELLHLLNAHDAYNVAGRHATNHAVPREKRLDWFVDGMYRSYDPAQDRDSMMGHGNAPTAVDVCRTVGDEEACKVVRGLSVPARSGVSLRGSVAARKPQL